MSRPVTRVRRLDIADALVREQLHVLHREVFSDAEWTGGVPKFTTGYWWLATVGGEPAAFAGMRPSFHWDSTGYLCSAGVISAFRGKGLQKLLVRRRVDLARALGWHTVITDTMSDNVSSMRSLIACGFRPYLPAKPWGDNDGRIYWRRLTKKEGRA